MTERRKKRLRRALRLALIATLCFIWGNSFLGKEDSASLSLGFTAWLRSIGLPVSEHFVRKSAHFCEFGLLGAETALLFWLRNGLGLQNGVNSAFACLLAAVTDETVQSFTGRGSQVRDVVLDFSGTVLAILICSAFAGYAEKRQHIQQQANCETTPPGD
ncbi:MAG: VanZ family protein [Oscillospiraceae bacterium]|nr:VanZ family protein [Oscillospiraceae bacterium]